MLSKINSYTLDGIEGLKVDIEVDINAGLPSYDIVGLVGTAVKESRERVRSAIKNSHFGYPLKKITINLAPADIKKEGAFDLPIAVGVLIASEQMHSVDYKDYIILGELSLDGSVKHIKGILPIIISGLQSGYKKFIIPWDNKTEASYIEGIEVFAVKSLVETCDFLEQHNLEKTKLSVYENIKNVNKYNVDFCEVKGQKVAKRALEIAVAGGHNILMIGPPGTGKTMLAKCVPTIMPVISFDEAIEVTKIHSIAGTLDSSEGIITSRPFRTPHHSATIPSLTGGGANSKPGEISLAHNGVLFLDEMPEYSRHALETLRQPLEDGVVTISRVKQTIEYPARFMLIASMNPCPCGNYGSDKPCKCSDGEIKRYISKLSGPLLDRIDLHVEVDSISYQDLRKDSVAENSATIKERVESARAIQRQRYKNSDVFTNAQMTNAMQKKYCKIELESEILLQKAYENLNLSARASSRILKVARTIADLEGSENILMNHIAEAIQYRSLDRKYWD
ncbi:MAG: YifB family Mg chelatase-like AAA ATPase [Clostridia bacterium]